MVSARELLLVLSGLSVRSIYGRLGWKAGKGSSGWGYAIVPVLGPLIGAGLAGIFLRAIGLSIAI